MWSLFGSCCCLYDVRFLVGLNALKKAVKSVDVGMRGVQLFFDLRVPSFSDVVGLRSGVVEMIPKLHICSFKPLLCHIVNESDDVYVDFLGVLLGAEPNTFYFGARGRDAARLTSRCCSTWWLILKIDSSSKYTECENERNILSL